MKSKDKPYKVTDRDGMYVRVGTNGAISFRYDYRENGRRETVTFGKYGSSGLSLARAREKCIGAKRMIQEGLSAAIEKQREKRRIKEAKSFGEFGEKWLTTGPMADSIRSHRHHGLVGALTVEPANVEPYRPGSMEPEPDGWTGIDAEMRDANGNVVAREAEGKTATTAAALVAHHHRSRDSEQTQTIRKTSTLAPCIECSAKLCGGTISVQRAFAAVVHTQPHTTSALSWAYSWANSDMDIIIQ